jgi:hypothetical protein
MLATMVDADRDGSPQPAMDDKLFTAAHDSLISPSKQLLLFLGFGKNRRCGKGEDRTAKEPKAMESLPLCGIFNYLRSS